MSETPGKQMKKRKVVFLTGTRADFGKLKPLMLAMETSKQFISHVFVTGMHMLSKYGYTSIEVDNSGFKNVFKFINQNCNDQLDHILAKTVLGLSDFVREIQPDMIIIHGDRIEALAGAIVGSMNQILVAHIEGGEVSGTIDELIRHSVTKLAHLHFVSNNEAKQRLLQLGEEVARIFVIGSPDIDVMNSNMLPTIAEVKRKYEIEFEKYGIMAFHPVTSELRDLKRQVGFLVDVLIESNENYVVIYPNNDPGSDVILSEYERIQPIKGFKVFPSMRFEYFLTLLKNSKFIIGNSSAGIREAPHYGVPAINVGTRQSGRGASKGVINLDFNRADLLKAISSISELQVEPVCLFGEGNSASLFMEIMNDPGVWTIKPQKYFVDRL